MASTTSVRTASMKTGKKLSTPFKGQCFVTFVYGCGDLTSENGGLFDCDDLDEAIDYEVKFGHSTYDDVAVSNKKYEDPDEYINDDDYYYAIITCAETFERKAVLLCSEVGVTVYRFDGKPNSFHPMTSPYLLAKYAERQKTGQAQAVFS